MATFYLSEFIFSNVQLFHISSSLVKGVNHSKKKIEIEIYVPSDSVFLLIPTIAFFTEYGFLPLRIFVSVKKLSKSFKIGTARTVREVLEMAQKVIGGGQSRVLSKSTKISFLVRTSGNTKVHILFFFYHTGYDCRYSQKNFQLRFRPIRVTCLLYN